MRKRIGPIQGVTINQVFALHDPFYGNDTVFRRLKRSEFAECC
jgi:hypothetical protein